MFDLFLQFFPACALMVTLFFVLTDEWAKKDKERRIMLENRVKFVDGTLRVLQEDGLPLCDIDIATYFDELPQMRRF